LTVEFYRIQTVSCLQDGNGNPAPDNVYDFLERVDNENITCGLTCDVVRGPFSPMRGGSANNIYVIPSPTVIAFGTATLMAAGCCIPAILSMMFMWGKILEINWKARFGNRADMDQLIEGTNGATVGTMKGINDMVRFFLSVVEIPVFGGLVLAILVLGEKNFFSDQVRYQTEPMFAVGTYPARPPGRPPPIFRCCEEDANISPYPPPTGQWAPIVGTAFAAFGSLYLLLAETVREETKSTELPTRPCTCQHPHHDGGDDPEPQQDGVLSPMRREAPAADVRAPSPNRTPAAEMQEVPGRRRLPRASTYSPGGASAVTDSSPSDTDDVEAPNGRQPKRSWTSTTDVGKRRQVRHALAKLGGVFVGTAHGAFDISDFRQGRATEFPTIPGEEHRNPDLNRVLRTYNGQRDNHDEEGGDITPSLNRQRSRANSFRSVASGADGEAGPSTPKARRALSRSPSPLRSRDTFPRERVSLSDVPAPGSPPSPGSATPRAPTRRVTLTVPSSSHHGHVRNNSSASSPRPTIIMTGERSPSIVVSPDPETYSPVDDAPSDPAPHHSNSEK